jgi:uncharacterized protein with von Willebrand factor type A (vWA) domain
LERDACFASGEEERRVGRRLDTEGSMCGFWSRCQKSVLLAIFEQK